MKAAIQQKPQWPGIALALGLPVLFSLLQTALHSSVSGYTMVIDQFLSISGLLLMGLLLFFYIKKVEGKGLSSVGLQRLTFKQTMLAIGLGVYGFLIIMTIFSIISIKFPELGPTGPGSPGNHPLYLIIYFTIYPLVYEFMIRAYPIPRLIDSGLSPGLTLSISVVAYNLLFLDVFPSAFFFGVVLPRSILLALLFFKNRNLTQSMIANVFMYAPVFIYQLISSLVR
ncbi:hypothetical protein AB9P05_04345 [Roseivirga sp. BDSF3-8]|uniref:hypothetical protein n=1 Tax=Roseivirga sp. BDSF3-8 TaxID=3241598 RepID=UPI0035323629